MMKINTNSWHFRLINQEFNAYETTNLCQYCRRLMAMLALYGLLLPVLVVMYVSVMLIFTPVLLPFGVRPVNLFSDTDRYRGDVFTLYERFDCGLLGRRYPIDFMLGLGAIALIVHGVITFPLVVACIMGVPSLLMALYFLIGWLRKQDSETLTLAKEWVSAKKAGVCPLITFIDPTKETIVND
jgi:hypothetical protein